MYNLGIALVVVGLVAIGVGITLIVKNARIAEPVAVENVVEQWPYTPGTVVLDEESKPYIADVATIPTFMRDVWAAGVKSTGVKIERQQDMPNGTTVFAALVPQTPGACGHEECQPENRNKHDHGDEGEGFAPGQYL